MILAVITLLFPFHVLTTIPNSSVGGIMGGIDTGKPTIVENRGNNCKEYLNHYYRQMYFSSIVEIRLQTILVNSQPASYNQLVLVSFE